MNRFLVAPALIAGCLSVAACSPTAMVSTTTVVASGAPMTFNCPVDGTIRVTVNGGTLVLTSSFGSETYTGGPTTYFGDETSVTLGSGSLVWAELGAQQTCMRIG